MCVCVGTVLNDIYYQLKMFHGEIKDKETLLLLRMVTQTVVPFRKTTDRVNHHKNNRGSLFKATTVRILILL